MHAPLQNWKVRCRSQVLPAGSRSDGYFNTLLRRRDGPVSLLLPWYHRAPCAGNGRRYSTRHYSASSVGVSGVCVLLGSPYVVLSYRIPPLANVFVSLVVIMGKVTHGIRNNHNSQIHLCCTFILNYIDRKNSFRIQFGHGVNNRF